MVGASIYTLLSGHTALTDIVGTNIFPLRMPQEKEDPAVVFGVEEQKPEDTKSDVSSEDWTKITIVAYSKDYDQNHLIHQEIRNALDGQKGTIAGFEVSALRFQDFEDGWEESRESYAGISMYLLITSP